MPLADLQQLERVLGPGVLVVPCAQRSKRPIRPYQDRLDELFFVPPWRELCASEVNLAVLLGRRSGGLCTIDFDIADFGFAWDDANPVIAEATTRTVGARGWQVWLRLIDDIPPTERTQQCEWRADGSLAMFCGIHPSGVHYRLANDRPPVQVRFEDIQWPNGWTIPGLNRLQREALAKLENDYGAPFFNGPKGEPNLLNEPFWAALYAQRHLTLRSPTEGRFYAYDEATGLWRVEPEEAIKARVSDMLLGASRQMNVPWLARQRDHRRLNAITSQIGTLTVRPDPWQRTADVIHVANGVLAWRNGEWQFERHSPDYMSRNASPVAWNPGAGCPRFREELLARCLDSDDVAILQMFVGLFLLGRNLIQKILLIDGEAGTGKSQIAHVIRGLIGPHNCVNLRTDLLQERFEIANYIGKTLLLGSDVSSDFLSNRSAPTLKALVGGDQLMAEIKGCAEPQIVQGTFNVLITANSRLRLRIQDDVEAWRRRLVVLTSAASPAERPIPDFGARLLVDEGPGILNWAVDGLRWLYSALESNSGRLPLTAAQSGRINRAIAESDSLRVFLRERVRTSSTNDLATDELLTAYAGWCADQDLHPIPESVAQKLLPTLMLELFQVARSKSVVRNGRDRNGYSRVELTLGATP
ncbi:MAG: bifunctional DNA primase/polymerase [Verrucomicrobiales bacterium]|nr:bifunctional DNA primase/polymerase [Verrucomicrobiales bacterium]